MFWRPRRRGRLRSTPRLRDVPEPAAMYSSGRIEAGFPTPKARRMMVLLGCGGVGVEFFVGAASR
jgi:hypothetical protein